MFARRAQPSNPKGMQSMDIEALKEALKSDEAKAVLAEITEEATKGLKAKNDELLAKLKKAGEEKSEAEKKAEEIEAEKKAAEEEAALKSGDVEKIKQQLEEKHKKELDALKQEKATTDTRLHDVLVNDGLTTALTKAGVNNPSYLDAAKALIKSSHKAEIGESGAMLDGAPLQEFVTTWTQGENGKHFVSAANNSGGGSNGANGGGQASGAKKADMSVKEKTAFIRENGKDAYDKLN